MTNDNDPRLEKMCHESPANTGTEADKVLSGLMDRARVLQRKPKPTDHIHKVGYDVEMEAPEIDSALSGLLSDVGSVIRDLAGLIDHLQERVAKLEASAHGQKASQG